MQNKDLNILIVEDEDNLANTLHEYLELKGFNCKLAMNAKDARAIFLDSDFSAHVVLMDIGLPDGDGLDLAKEFRQKRKDFILLFLSALNDPDTKFEGLSLGAEDYITKPFDLRELILRLERILKTQSVFKTYQDEIVIGELKIWFKKYELQDANGELLPLAQKECAILEMLYFNKGNVVSRDEIIENIWGKDVFPSNRTVDNYIVKLRKWAQSDSNEPLTISSIRGIGYKLEIKE